MVSSETLEPMRNRLATIICFAPTYKSLKRLYQEGRKLYRHEVRRNSRMKKGNRSAPLFLEDPTARIMSIGTIHKIRSIFDIVAILVLRRHTSPQPLLPNWCHGSQWQPNVRIALEKARTNGLMWGRVAAPMRSIGIWYRLLSKADLRRLLWLSLRLLLHFPYKSLYLQKSGRD